MESHVQRSCHVLVGDEIGTKSTHLMVLWDKDNKRSVIPRSKVVDEAAKTSPDSMLIGQSLLCIWSGKQLQATVLAAGKPSDKLFPEVACRSPPQILYKPFTSNAGANKALQKLANARDNSQNPAALKATVLREKIRKRVQPASDGALNADEDEVDLDSPDYKRLYLDAQAALKAKDVAIRREVTAKEQALVERDEAVIKAAEAEASEAKAKEGKEKYKGEFKTALSTSLKCTHPSAFTARWLRKKTKLADMKLQLDEVFN
jgi:hypothetical protein